MEKENFVVIGSNCFSGACFIDHILKDNPAATVTAVSRSAEYENLFLPYKKIASNRVQFHQLNLNDDTEKIVSIIRDFETDYIVNFAAQGMVAESWSNPEQWFQTNCFGLMKLADRLTAENVPLKRFVQVSSPEVYGASTGETEEEAHYKPSSPYAASKAAGDLSLYPYYLHKGLPVVYTRATNVYGPYQQPYRIIPRSILFIKKGLKIQLHGGGRAVKSYIHIRDVCDATLKIARNGRNGEVYHISPDNHGISIHDLVGKICTRMGRKMEGCVEIVAERFGQDDTYVINSDKLRQELGWHSLVSLEEGLDEVITWVEENYTELRKLPFHYIHKE
jgi:dTDP-glucose 4,6-dehydratase